ncbi:hypothetical protein [Pseudolactococcus insecticola]|uniref:Uncharacterized protein n=1 Tax=Pseudolactococcus insecticola TaxID=2709158 RepID=A0A6A0B5B5_9LACT|nr:hypothetical protein [Lactococcus insecticola]GFH39721.1 hypothetical protein Hs20B_01190 [Lactococcus insecticola]
MKIHLKKTQLFAEHMVTVHDYRRQILAQEQSVVNLSHKINYDFN